jgi:hypothetical protein
LERLRGPGGDGLLLFGIALCGGAEMPVGDLCGSRCEDESRVQE